MGGVASFDALLQEAEQHPVRGWDFSWLGGRLTEQPLPWDYEAMLVARARRSPDLLDLGTGGGEFLAGLAYRPPRTVATEGWPANVEEASRRLQPLGIDVVANEGTPDNDQQVAGAVPVRLPFADESFALIASRHESYVAGEVRRVLARGGVFLTQQVGGDYGEFYEALGLTRPPARSWSLDFAVVLLDQAGLDIRGSGEGVEATSFFDVGAFAWYLTAIPWVVEGFSIGTHRPQLRLLHRRLQKEGSITIRQSAFWVEAQKPHLQN